MQKMWVQSLGQEDPLEEGMAIHSSILAWRISMDREAWWAPVCSVSKVAQHSKGLKWRNSFMLLTFFFALAKESLLEF